MLSLHSHRITSATATVWLFSLLLLFCGSALAKDYLVMEGVSYHFKKNEERNALNLGFGFESSPTNKIGWQFGTFQDSFHQSAAYAGINYALKPFSLFGQSARFIPSLNVMRKKFAKKEYVSTRVVPIPVLEVCIRGNVVLNVGGSPRLDYDGVSTNGVLFFSLKLPMRSKAAHC